MRSIVVALLMCLTWAHAAVAVVKGRTIEYKQGDTTFVGFLAWDDAVAKPDSPRPGVLVCPEWWGNNDYAHQRALQLAGLGYVAFAIDVYGKESDGKAKIASDAKQAGEWAGALMQNPSQVRDRAKAAYDTLTAEKIVDKANIAAIGYCMGGTVALELARTGADLKVVVTFHTSTILAKNADDNKKIKAAVLVCHGADDAFMPREDLFTFQDQMKAAGVDYQVATYGGAVHSFTNKAADGYKIDGVKYNADADKRSWEHMRTLFKEKLKI